MAFLLDLRFFKWLLMPSLSGYRTQRVATISLGLLPQLPTGYSAPNTDVRPCGLVRGVVGLGVDFKTIFLRQASLYDRRYCRFHDFYYSKNQHLFHCAPYNSPTARIVDLHSLIITLIISTKKTRSLSGVSIISKT